jgi:hypothetical protein
MNNDNDISIPIYNVKSIRNIYNIIRANYDFSNATIAEFKFTEVPIATFNDFNKDLQESSNNYLDFEFAYKYLQKCNKCYHITYKELNMYVILETKITSKMKTQLFRNLYRVYLISKIYNISKWGNKIFNYYIIMNPLKRCLPSKKDEVIGAQNINGGYTYINKNNIYIIRKEDYNKVIIHELLHHNTFIHKQEWEPQNIRRLKEHFNINQKMLLIPNEAIIETYACVLNTVFHSIETGTSLNENLKKDKEHSIILAKKILDKQDGKLWIEKTHSYCYIVFKTILYFHFNNFLKIYKYKNDTEITDFLIKYWQRIYRRIKRLKQTKQGNNRLKQTIY